MNVVSTEELIREYLASGRKLTNHIGYVETYCDSLLLIDRELLKKYRLEFINSIESLNSRRVYFFSNPSIKNIKKIEI